jgi:hypothetical protein
MAVGKPTQVLRKLLKSNWQVLLAACVLCAGLSAAFLLKGEDTNYYGVASGTSFGTSGVSAYTYYFVWPKSQRETVAQNEEFVAILNAMSENLPTSDLPDRMRRNIILAIVFGTASAILAIALWVVKFPSGSSR